MSDRAASSALTAPPRDLCAAAICHQQKKGPVLADFAAGRDVIDGNDIGRIAREGHANDVSRELGEADLEFAEAFVARVGHAHGDHTPNLTAEADRCHDDRIEVDRLGQRLESIEDSQ